MGLNFSIERLAGLRSDPAKRGRFGVEVKEIDVPRISDEELKHLLLNLYENRVVVLRTQGLTKEEFVEWEPQSY